MAQTTSKAIYLFVTFIIFVNTEGMKSIRDLH